MKGPYPGNIPPEKLAAAKELVDDYYYGQQHEVDDPADFDERRPADGHYAEEDVVHAMQRIERLLSSVGLQLHGYSPGVSAYDKESGNYIRFEHAGWVWLEEILVRFVEMREFLREFDYYASRDEKEKAAIIEDCVLRTRHAWASVDKLRNLLASTLKVRGDAKGRDAVQLLRDVAQWHRASGDTAVCDHEADALDLLADQLGGMQKDAAESRPPEFGSM